MTREDYPSLKDSYPILASSSTCEYSTLVTKNILGHYIFRIDLTKAERCDLYAITIAAIDKTIINAITMGDPNLSKGADGFLLWQRLDEQILSPDLNYFAQKKNLHAVESISRNHTETPEAFMVQFNK
mmetsp:Transcript_57305/g.68950  ORF Transcript_57305/g.68950 Transcript_57305/m.68950 type:complete len:128 (+) Transcript_57305:93-476(+)